MSYVAAVLRDQPVLFWPFDQNGTTVKDITGNGYNTSVTVDAVAPVYQDTPLIAPYRSLNLGQGQTGSGNSYINYAYQSGLDVGTGEFTVEMWMRSNGNNANYGDLFIRDSAHSGNGQILYTNISDGKILCWCGGTPLHGATTLTDDKAHHVVASRTAGVLKLYVDGIQDATVASTGNTNTSSPIFLNFGNAQARIPLRISMFAYYKYGLSPSQIQKHYIIGKRGMGNAGGFGA